MIRTFCDNCGTEIIDANDPRPRGMPLLLNLVRQLGKEQVSVPVTLGNAAYQKQHYTSGKDPEHICLYCVIDGLAKLDKRPKPPAQAPRLALEDATYVQLQARLKYMEAPPAFPLMPAPLPVSPYYSTPPAIDPLGQPTPDNYPEGPGLHKKD